MQSDMAVRLATSQTDGCVRQEPGKDTEEIRDDMESEQSDSNLGRKRIRDSRYPLIPIVKAVKRKNRSARGHSTCRADKLRAVGKARSEAPAHPTVFNLPVVTPDFDK